MTTMAIELRKRLSDPEIIERFQAALGRHMSANSFVQSVLVYVADNPRLQTCTPNSVIKAALRAATLRLSVDPAQRQAYIVPRRVKIKDAQGNVKYEDQAVFQDHYNGLYTLAMRGNIYRFLNVSPIYKGQEIYEDPMTGLHYFDLGNGVVGMPEQTSRLRRVTDGRQGEVIGYLGYLKTWKGFERTVYMTIKDIHEHAHRYNPTGYDSKDGAWQKDANTREAMERKTVLRALLRQADLTGIDLSSDARAVLNDEEVEHRDADVTDAKVTDVTDDIEDIGKVNGTVWRKHIQLAEEAHSLGISVSDIDPMEVSNEDVLNSNNVLHGLIKAEKANAGKHVATNSYDAVFYASTVWNVTMPQAKKNLKGSVPDKMLWEEFKHVVDNRKTLHN